ncbi:hypothetical protein COO60DRAFT_1699611 [Scenedesmus sp. NREL 46B-D3]|nr:hypothetical protein COO60DRAFT_1699611 [Scenedesmus sp. NREL 46B-D3]
MHGTRRLLRRLQHAHQAACLGVGFGPACWLRLGECGRWRVMAQERRKGRQQGCRGRGCSDGGYGGYRCDGVVTQASSFKALAAHFLAVLARAIDMFGYWLTGGLVGWHVACGCAMMLCLQRCKLAAGVAAWADGCCGSHMAAGCAGRHAAAERSSLALKLQAGVLCTDDLLVWCAQRSPWAETTAHEPATVVMRVCAVSSVRMCVQCHNGLRGDKQHVSTGHPPCIWLCTTSADRRNDWRWRTRERGAAVVVSRAAHFLDVAIVLVGWHVLRCEAYVWLSAPASSLPALHWGVLASLTTRLNLINRNGCRKVSHSGGSLLYCMRCCRGVHQFPWTDDSLACRRLVCVHVAAGFAWCWLTTASVSASTAHCSMLLPCRDNAEVAILMCSI